MPCGFFAHLTSLFFPFFILKCFAVSSFQMDTCCSHFPVFGAGLIQIECFRLFWRIPTWRLWFPKNCSACWLLITDSISWSGKVCCKWLFFWWLLKRYPFSPSPASRRILGPVDPPQFWEKQGKKSGKSQNKTWRRQRVRGTAPLESASGARVAQ